MIATADNFDLNLGQYRSQQFKGKLPNYQQTLRSRMSVSNGDSSDAHITRVASGLLNHSLNGGAEIYRAYAILVRISNIATCKAVKLQTQQAKMALPDDDPDLTAISDGVLNLIDDLINQKNNPSSVTQPPLISSKVIDAELSTNDSSSRVDSTSVQQLGIGESNIEIVNDYDYDYDEEVSRDSQLIEVLTNQVPFGKKHLYQKLIHFLQASIDEKYQKLIELMIYASDFKVCFFNPTEYEELSFQKNMQDLKNAKVLSYEDFLQLFNESIVSLIRSRIRKNTYTNFQSYGLDFLITPLYLSKCLDIYNGFKDSNSHLNLNYLLNKVYSIDPEKVSEQMLFLIDLMSGDQKDLHKQFKTFYDTQASDTNDKSKAPELLKKYLAKVQPVSYESFLDSFIPAFRPIVSSIITNEKFEKAIS